MANNDSIMFLKDNVILAKHNSHIPNIKVKIGGNLKQWNKIGKSKTNYIAYDNKCQWTHLRMTQLLLKNMHTK